MTELPLVSFIIPYYNAGDTIQETIDSIYNQSYQNFDIYIVNDGSTDVHSFEKLIDFEGNDKITVLHQENSGPCTARNKVIPLVKSEFLVFLDADDRIEDGALNIMLNQIDSNTDVLFGNCQYLGDKQGIKKQQIPTKKDILYTNYIAVCCLCRTKTIQKFLFDEHLNRIGLEDWELWIHLFSKNAIFQYLDATLFGIRVSPNSRTFEVANYKIPEAKKYIAQKHSDFLYEQFLELYIENRSWKQHIDYKIGKFALAPYRYMKYKLLGK
jgi:glycosyltransferase involved in cell wall biosynthesis